MSVPHEGYSRNAPWALNYMFTFIFHLYVQHPSSSFIWCIFSFSWYDITESVLPIKILLDRGLIFTRKLLLQGFLLVKLKLSLRPFYGCQQHLVNSYRVSLSPDMTHIVHHVIVNISNTTYTTNGVKTSYPLWALKFNLGLKWGSCCSIMYCLSFVDLWFLTTP